MTDQQAQRDLAFIRQIMDESRSFATIGGNHFIIWGTVIALALLGTWLRTLGYATPPPLWIWLACVALGWVLTAVLIVRLRRFAAVVHPSGRAIGAAWTALGIAMTLSFFLGTGSDSIGLAAIPGLSAAFFGAGIYINGVLARIGWLRNLALLWWASAALMLYHPGRYSFALLAVLMLALYVVPGIALNCMARRAAA